MNLSTAQSGEVHSPNYPSAYPDNIDKTFTITASKGKAVQIMFTSLQVEEPQDFGSQECFDYVTIRDSEGSQLLDETCGSVLPPIIRSKSNQVFLMNSVSYNLFLT